jgi:hypothetical protein
MRRHLVIAALVSGLIAAPMWAQMRGGARAGGAPIGRPGFASRGPMMANRGAFIGTRFGSRFGMNFHGQIFFANRFHHHNRFFFGSSPWWYYGYPAYYGGYSYPLLWNTAASYDSSSAYYDELRQMAQEINRLSNEVEQLREEQEYRQSTPPAQPPVQTPQPQAKSEPREPTVLVFRDKHTQEVKNYAIVGQTLWIFNEYRATKVPLSSLDVDATTKLNDERGVEFSLPK